VRGFFNLGKMNRKELERTDGQEKITIRKANPPLSLCTWNSKYNATRTLRKSNKQLLLKGVLPERQERRAKGSRGKNPGGRFLQKNVN